MTDIITKGDFYCVLGAIEVQSVGIHPSFNLNGADVILRSCDGIEFHVHSVMLGIISPIFQGLFSMPRDSRETWKSPIQMAERADQMAYMLGAAYQFGRPQKEASVEFLWGMVEVADKLQMDGFTMYLRERLSVALETEKRIGITPDFEAMVMHAYVEASNRSWMKEVREWSSMTLSSNISRSHLDKILNRASEKSRLALLKLHQLRREAVVRGLMRVSFHGSVSHDPNGIHACDNHWPATVDGLLGDIDIVHELVQCDGTADHDQHLCTDKWGAFIIALAVGLLPLNPEVNHPVWNSVWDMGVTYNRRELPVTLRELVRRAGRCLPEQVDMND